MDMDQRRAKKPGRIILLGDGSEVLTGSEDTEMFDQSEEDEDLASQATKGDDKAPPKSDAEPEKLHPSSTTEKPLPTTSASKSE
jgi:protein phosphatase 2C family protein 2/3